MSSFYKMYELINEAERRSRMARAGNFAKGVGMGMGLGAGLWGVLDPPEGPTGLPPTPGLKHSIPIQIRSNQPEQPKQARQSAPRIDLHAIAKYVEEHEGGELLHAYDDHNPHRRLVGDEAENVYDAGRLTIGVGHLLKKESEKIFNDLFGNEVDFHKIIRGEQYLTDEQAYRLFLHDLQEHVERAVRLFPDLATYPVHVQQALVDAVYRGDMGPKTAKLINLGAWNLAAREYLRHKGYKTAEARGMRGIKTRMERNQGAMLRHAEDSMRVQEQNEEDVDESQVDLIYDKTRLAVQLVRLYDQSLPVEKRLLRHISTIANLASGAYGLYNSTENHKEIPPNMRNSVRYKFGPQMLNQLDQMPEAVLTQYMPELQGKVARGSIIRVNIRRIVRELHDTLRAVVEIASTIVHEATHELEFQGTGKSSEAGPKQAEHAFVQWVTNNWNSIVQKIPELGSMAQ